MIGLLTPLRRKFISAPLLNWYRKVLPPMSDTEREALEAGTVWWDAELFSGRPKWGKLLDMPPPRLSAEEQAFMDGPVDELCAMLDDWKITHELRDLPPEVWAYIKDQGFLGMIIPKRYGGLEFSALGHSAVVTKISTRSVSAGVSVMVPNSLGPAELLLHYGTEDQKNHYLPRLARGEELPAFALTGTYAGSDAAAMRDIGVVCYENHQGKRTLGMRVNWEKRYITLGPVATVLGVAFKLTDPDHLLGDQEDLGITLALIPTDTPGVEIGRRHWPSMQAFQNGPNQGRDVFVPMDWVIGGQERVGQGWRMLMEALAAGRSISLPSQSTGATRFCARVTGAYARVRKQFRVPVGQFEGVQEALARIAVNAYVLDAARQITCAAVDQGAKPAVLSAILKYHATERMRQSVNDAMDVHGGKAICEGPSNYLAPGYHSIPIGITVEGANILTRSMIIFGQGAIRAHPYVLDEMLAVAKTDPQQALEDFDKALFGHIGFTLGNAGRALWHNLTGGVFAAARDTGPTTKYFQQISRDAASFALLADMAMLTLGGELKRKESLSARFGDVLSELYLLSCVLKRYEDDGRPAADWPLVEHACQQGLYTVQQRFDAILDNFPKRGLAWLLRRVVLPLGRRRRLPSDALGQRCAELLLTPSEARDRLTSGIYMGKGPDDVSGIVDYALDKVLAAEAVEAQLVKVGHQGSLEDAVAAGLIGEADARTLREAEEATLKVIRVDDFSAEALTGAYRQDRTLPKPAVAQAG